MAENKIVLECPRCHETLTAPERAAGKTGKCDHCGESVPIPAPPQAASSLAPAQQRGALPTVPTAGGKSSGSAIAGMVFGILSVFPGLLCGGPLWALCGLAFSLTAMSDIRRFPDRYEGRGMAIAGLTTSIVGLVIGLLFLGTMLLLGTSFAAAFAPLVKHLPPPP